MAGRRQPDECLVGNVKERGIALMDQVLQRERIVHARRRISPHVLVFITSASVMVIELVASRLIAPRVGVSLHTWTAVIGITLAGGSLGNYLGGRLADRWASSSLLGTILLLASLSTLLILWLNNDLHDAPLPTQVPLMVWILLYVGAVFMLPSVLLGCVSPIVVKLSVTDLQRTGSTVGGIYACSVAGSIVGTFATGFFLISALGTKPTLLIIAGILLLLALWFLGDNTRRRVVVRVALSLTLFGAGIGLLSYEGYLRSECLRETNYFCINVYESRADGRTIYELLLDRLVHSYSDLEDPTHLVYGYERTYAEVIAPLAAQKPDLDVMFIGGGGYTFPRYLEATLPQSRLVVAEIDPEVTEIAYERLGLARDTRIETHNMDARSYFTYHAEADAFDVVFGDAFNDYSVPFHLTTREFDQLVDRSLRSGGLYLANIIDGGPHGHFFRAYVRTLQSVFAHVAVIPSMTDWQKASRTTFVIIASQEPLELEHLSAEFQPLSAEELESYLAQESVRLLTDDYVPVDNLMAPVVEDSFSFAYLTPEMTQLIMVRLIVIGAAIVLLVVGLIVWRLRRRARLAAVQGR